jgi:hypothetical protein
VQPTRPSLLVTFAVIAAAGGYLLASLSYGTLPAVPRTWVVTIVVLAALQWALARSVRARLAGRPRTTPISPLVVARCAALARAGSAAAALLGGVYLGFGLVTLGSLEKSAYSRDAVTCLVGLLAAALMLAAALYLERVCRVPRPPKRPPEEPPIGSST